MDPLSSSQSSKPSKPVSSIARVNESGDNTPRSSIQNSAGKATSSIFRATNSENNAPTSSISRSMGRNGEKLTSIARTSEVAKSTEHDDASQFEMTDEERSDRRHDYFRRKQAEERSGKKKKGLMGKLFG